MRNYLILALFCAIGTMPLQAQKEKFKALFIYNFTKNVEWPPQTKHDHFVIGVIGNSTITTELETIAKTQKVVGLPIKVVSYNTIDAMQFCHLIYLAPNRSNLLSNLVTQINGKGTLVVTDGKDLTDKGAGINFFEDGDKLRFEISKKRLSDQGLKCSSSLFQLGVVRD